MISVVTVVNSDELDEELGMTEDSVITLTKLLLTVDFCLVIVNRR